MARVTVRLPRLLASVLEGRTDVDAHGETLREVLDDLVRRHPQLSVHLFDEGGDFRQHVLCFHNRTNTRWQQGLVSPVAEGDVVTILQAVSGG